MNALLVIIFKVNFTVLLLTHLSATEPVIGKMCEAVYSMEHLHDVVSGCHVRPLLCL